MGRTPVGLAKAVGRKLDREGLRGECIPRGKGSVLYEGLLKSLRKVARERSERKKSTWGFGIEKFLEAYGNRKILPRDSVFVDGVQYTMYVSEGRPYLFMGKRLPSPLHRPAHKIISKERRWYARMEE